MSIARNALKAAKVALDAKVYDKAAEEARKVVAADSKNYHGYVFLGLALEKQDENEAAEAAYKSAVRLKGKDVLVWQGLVSLYEKQTSHKLDEYHDAALYLAQIFMEADDKIKCQNVIDKYTGDAKKYGSRSQLKRSLETLLPSSPIYDYLEGRIPQPAFTYSKLAEIIEAEERERVNLEIGQRRTRLGARIEQVTAEVTREVLENSPLEGVYSDIINWTHDDETRRRYEEKLLQRAYDTLATLPALRKAAKRQEVIEMARGLVTLKHPFLLAWKILLEWNDVKEISSLDSGVLSEYVALFPEDGLSKVVKGYLESDNSPFPKLNNENIQKSDEEDDEGVMSAEDRLILMTEGLEDASKSILAHRLMGQYYLFLDEYDSAVSTARSGQNCVEVEAALADLVLSHTRDAMKTILASALVQYQAPRHHAEARAIFEEILRRNPSETSALLGIGMIYEEQDDFAEAVNFLTRALRQSEDPKIKAEVAWCKALNDDYESGLRELNACLPEMEGSDAKTKYLRSQTLYRIGMCLWSLDTSRSARRDRNGAYARFIGSLQADMNFAPAYTSLGIYYADYSKDKKRARKCFQKAFELSASEVDAAHRLAQLFAQSGEWDLVEVVSLRVVESGKIRPAPGSKRQAISWPYAALGVVQLNNQEHSKSIVSFQSALRISPRDYHCWVGLGESYHNSGRYIAATKAFEHAHELEEGAQAESSWFSEYMLANVRRELGEYDDAVCGYQRVLADRSKEYGVLLALLQTIVEYGWRSAQLGFFGRAAKSAKEAIRVAQEITLVRNDGINLWKAVGDACSIFSSIQEYESMLPKDDLKILLEAGADPTTFEVLANIDNINRETLRQFSSEHELEDRTIAASIKAAILAQKRVIRASASDLHARAVAWYNLGCTEHRAFVAEKNQRSTSSNSGYLRAAVQCFKQAIELEAGNAEFWNSLGIVASDLSPKVAQHAFVRSLYLNDKNARVWANLGAFYLLQEDHQLAHEAFTRAQSADPDYAQAWLGQGLLMAKSSDRVEARHLITHAHGIADSMNILIKKEFSTASFDEVNCSSSKAIDNVQPLLALNQLKSQAPSDLACRHLFSLFAERVGNFDKSVLDLELVCSQLEVEYEISESPISLARFAQVKADLARMQLASRDFEIAGENATTALDLSADEEDSKSRRKVRLSAYMTAGLAFYYRGSMDQSIEMFKNALSDTRGNPDIICLLAQVLWAKGGENEREVAREQLLDCIEKHPGHVNTTLLLGSMAVLDDDQDTVEAVRADLESLRANDELSMQDQGKITQLLTTIASIYPGVEGVEASEENQAETAIMLAPSKPHGWKQLAEVSGEAFPAEVAVLTAIKATPPRGDLEAEDVCAVYAGTGRLDDAQRAITVAPFRGDGWAAFE